MAQMILVSASAYRAYDEKDRKERGDGKDAKNCFFHSQTPSVEIISHLVIGYKMTVRCGPWDANA
jgi:hypothetical protein